MAKKFAQKRLVEDIEKDDKKMKGTKKGSKKYDNAEGGVWADEKKIARDMKSDKGQKTKGKKLAKKLKK